jgi:hypothetical protein
LGIDVRNADLAVLEIELFDTLLNSTSTDRNGGNLSFKTRDELGSLAIEELNAVSKHGMA